MSPRTYRKPVLGQRSTLKYTWRRWALNLSPRYGHDTGQRIACFDKCQLTITWMSNIKDICCKPRLHDLVLAGWPPCYATTSTSLGARACDPCRSACWPWKNSCTGFYFYSYMWLWCSARLAALLRYYVRSIFLNNIVMLISVLPLSP